MKTFLASPNRVAFGVFILSATLCLGCARGSRSGTMLGKAIGYGSIEVTVQNDDFKDATIYANWAGRARKRVGMVTGKTSQTFTVAWQSEAVQFDAEFVAGGTVAFEPIDVWEGEHLNLVIMNWADADQDSTLLRSAPAETGRTGSESRTR